MTETIKTKILERVVYVIRIALNILDPSSPLGLEHEVPDAIEDSEASERDAGLAPEGRDHPPAAADPRAVTHEVHEDDQVGGREAHPHPHVAARVSGKAHHRRLTPGAVQRHLYDHDPRVERCPPG